MRSVEELSFPEVHVGMTFLGGCGTNCAKIVMEQVSPNEFPALHILVGNTDANLLKRVFFPTQEPEWLRSWKSSDRFEIVQIGPKATKGLGAGGKPEVGKRAVLESIEAHAFDEYLAKLTAQICIAGLGGGTGHWALPELLKYSVSHNPDLLSAAIVTTPFAAEQHRCVIAAQALPELVRMAPIFKISNESVREIKPQSFDEAWKHIADMTIGRHLMVMRELFQEVGNIINSDFSDMRSVLCSGDGMLGVWEEKGDGELNAESIISSALANPLYDGVEILKNAAEVLVYVHGNIPPGFIQDQLIPAINEKRRIKDGQLHLGIRTDAGDGKNWVSIMGVAPHEVEPRRLEVLQRPELGRATGVAQETVKSENRSKAEGPVMILTKDGLKPVVLPMYLKQKYERCREGGGNPEDQDEVRRAIRKLTDLEVVFSKEEIRNAKAAEEIRSAKATGTSS